MKLKYILCAELCSVDGVSNKLSVFNLIEHIVAPAYPIALPFISIVFSVERTPDERPKCEVNIAILLDGRELSETTLEVEFEEAMIARAIGHLQGFFVPAPGSLEFHARMGGETIGVWHVPCIQAGRPEFQFVQAKA